MNLSDTVDKIKSIGSVRAKALNNIGIYTVEDITEFFPRRYEDRSEVRKINDLVENEENSFEAFVMSAPENVHVRKMTITRAVLGDETGRITAVWYNQSYLKNALKVDEPYVFTGKIEKKYSRVEAISPEFEKKSEMMLSAGRIVPVYALTKSISQKVMRGIIKTALSSITEELPEFMPKQIRMENKLCGRNFAIMNIHFPENDENFFIARRRVVFDELFLLQTALLQFKSKNGIEKSGILFKKVRNIRGVSEKALGFSMTNAQKKVLTEIEKDFTSG